VGRGSDRNPANQAFGLPANKSGGPYEFTRWDLVEARQIANIRPDYRLIKNYKFLESYRQHLHQGRRHIRRVSRLVRRFRRFEKQGDRATRLRLGPYTSRQKLEKFKRNELREYWAQLDVTENLSFRIGQQQIIWSEADALSGTEVTNSLDLKLPLDPF